MGAKREDQRVDEPSREDDLIGEIEDFNRESRKIRAALEKVGQGAGGALDTVVNVLFVASLATLAVSRFIFGWLDNMISLELGLLFVSIKIIWMIRTQQRYNHFVFWILHSIEYRQNLILRRMDGTEEGTGES
jgi:hypothetical protein